MAVLWPFCITGVQQCQVLTKTNKNELFFSSGTFIFTITIWSFKLRGLLLKSCSGQANACGEEFRLSVEGEQSIADASSEDNNIWSCCCTPWVSWLSSESGRPEMFSGGRRLSDQRRCRMLFLSNGRSSPSNSRYLCWWQTGPGMKEQHISSHLLVLRGFLGRDIAVDRELVIKILTGKEEGLSK